MSTRKLPETGCWPCDEVIMFMVFLPLAKVEAQRCAATLPVGETGVARARAAGGEGDQPPPRGRTARARLHAPGPDVVVQILRPRGSPGRPLRTAPGRGITLTGRRPGPLAAFRR